MKILHGNEHEQGILVSNHSATSLSKPFDQTRKSEKISFYIHLTTLCNLQTFTNTKL